MKHVGFDVDNYVANMTPFIEMQQTDTPRGDLWLVIRHILSPSIMVARTLARGPGARSAEVRGVRGRAVAI